MSETGYLALLLVAPLQSWGFTSRFQRGTTGLHATKSGIIGLISAAMGLAKGSPEESEVFPALAKLNMTSISMPQNDVRCLEDFRTAGGSYDKKTQPQFIPRKAPGGPCDNPTVNSRQYLLEGRFGVILAGDRSVLDRVAAALRHPVWGVWLWRKSCTPSLPVFMGPNESEEAAWKAVLAACRLNEASPMGEFTSVTEAERFGGGTDSLSDQPVSFGDGMSSGSDTRQFAIRHIRVTPARTGNPPPQIFVR